MDQFKGLRQKLTGYQRQIAARLRPTGAHVVDTGLVDSIEAAHVAAAQLRRGKVDVVFLYVSTYALSSTVLPVAQQASAPIILLNLQPVAQLVYGKFNSLADRGQMTGIWLKHCQTRVCPEIAHVFGRVGILFRMVTAVFDEPSSSLQIGEWVKASRLRRTLRPARIRILVH